jgi:ATP-dependent protease ClpP protease subunit
MLLLGCSNAYAEEAKSPEGELSNLTMIRGDTAYIKIYSTLTSVDDTSLQNDLWIIGTMPQVKNIMVYLNSSGGVAYTGFSLADLFVRAQKKYNVEVYASGVVASAAVVVFASIEKRYAGQSTSFLVHELRFQPSSTEKYSFTPSELERMDRLFAMLTDTYLDILMTEGSGLPREEWAKMMKEETWFTASQAVEWGLVKEIR